MNLRNLKLIQDYAVDREAELIDSYIQHGPTVLQIRLGLTDEEWEVIFDYLVFEHNLLYKTVVFSTDFFIEEYIRYGSEHIRELLSIESSKYNQIWEMLFDFIAIANEAVHYHFLQNRDKYLHNFRVRGGTYLKRVLGLNKPKYCDSWGKVLLALHAGFCENAVDDLNFDHALKGFMDIVNVMRVHRRPVKSEIFRGGLV